VNPPGDGRKARVGAPQSLSGQRTGSCLGEKSAGQNDIQQNQVCHRLAILDHPNLVACRF
jgi:hypothetical protein